MKDKYIYCVLVSPFVMKIMSSYLNNPHCSNSQIIEKFIVRCCNEIINEELCKTEDCYGTADSKD